MKKEKGLHSRNIHLQEYNFDALIKDYPSLASFVKKNKYDALGIDFFNPNAVLTLNQALLAHHYKVIDWSVPKGHLCPPVPGRADYIHYIADLLAEAHDGKPPVGTKIKGLDIGSGTSCIYPILGNCIYGWKFVGSDISSDAINHANKILNSNPTLKKNIKTRFQKSAKHTFKDLIKSDEKFDFTMCNPPFYSSLEEAKNASSRKVKNLNVNKVKKGHTPVNKNNPSNFGGIKAELWCPGGEISFIKEMIKESIIVKDQCRWFTTLVSKASHLTELDKFLQGFKPTEIRTLEMHHGQKTSQILVWRF
ncbi:MAG: 23S rRNA (adenine(1618)-N(6))-methyltransferase RlmF [Halobacteriovoraceae bacterium]|jgi:23S rRNA (adenine1618-N6)-methyltransferase|nr:23S rRNA (adenine(1618)-N(6))-methyltransferase RlmF [Halobacteriovoraceae bacterium]